MKNLSVERWLGDWMRGHLPHGVVEFVMFGLKMAWARLWMPMVAAAVLSSSFLYLAENVGTLTGTWLYSGTASFSFASIAKMGSWYLLLFVSFVQVSLVYRHVLVSDGEQEE